MTLSRCCCVTGARVYLYICICIYIAYIWTYGDGIYACRRCICEWLCSMHVCGTDDSLKMLLCDGCDSYGCIHMHMHIYIGL